ncbi:MAG: hypothetical protein ACREB2_11120 [Pseudolabrys sp.]
MLKWIVCLLSLACAQAAVAETVHSLDQVPKHLKTPQAKEFFQEQIEGKPAPDKLGVHLPAALPAPTAAKLLVPASDRAAPTLVGAKPWPGHMDLYVVIVCTGGAGPLGSDPQCAQGDPGSKEPALHVYLGVIEAKDDTPPRLVAASGAVDGAMSWDDTGLPKSPMAADDAGGGPTRPEAFDRFDLAPYKIAPGQIAFGLRVSWSESYSGGGANYTGLCLFVVDDGRLRQVLAVPMSAYADIAGDWHKDRTRDHDITDSANVLVVSGHSTDGHYDLIVKNGKERWQRVYRWSKDIGAYRAAEKPGATRG